MRGLFSKAEYIEVILPFICDDNSKDVDACIVSIEALKNFKKLSRAFKSFK